MTDDLLSDLATRVRRLEPSDADVQSILRRAHAGQSRQPSPRRVAVALAAAAVAITLLVPGARTAVADALDSFFGGSVPEHQISGVDLSGRRLPRWLIGQTRHGLVVAGHSQTRLIAYRDQTAYCFAFGSAVGICDSAHGWTDQLVNHPVVLYGPTPQHTLYGLTRGDVSSVRLTFAHHHMITIPTPNGGFAITTQPRWQIKQFETLDSHGQRVSQQPLP